jgi:hypothetical protein
MASSDLVGLGINEAQMRALTKAYEVSLPHIPVTSGWQQRSATTSYMYSILIRNLVLLG